MCAGLALNQRPAQIRTMQIAAKLPIDPAPRASGVQQHGMVGIDIMALFRDMSVLTTAAADGRVTGEQAREVDALVAELQALVKRANVLVATVDRNA